MNDENYFPLNSQRLKTKIAMNQFLRLILVAFGFLTLINPLHAQERQVSGTVLSDDDNAGLPGVTVTNRNTNQRVVTNSVGYFSIAAEKGHVLVFTYVGFARQEMTVGDVNLINVKLVPAEKAETVVTVYGIRGSKRAQGSATQEVKGEEIALTRRENFLNSLSGRVAGATITPTSGTPGASSTIVLRGAVSLGGNNQPLFVVDGVPYDNQSMNQENLSSGTQAGTTFANRNSDYGNRAMDLNPEDIESITILKGPEATALYGSDGASGAIVVTTRKGKAGRATVTYNNSFRWDKVTRFPEIQKTYMRGSNGVANLNATVNPFAGGELAAYFGPKYAEGTQFFDNFNAFFGTGFSQNHNLNVEGGAEGTTYRLSANYIDQDGIVPNTAYKRATLRLTATQRMSSKVNMSTSMTYTGSKTNKAPRGTGSYFLSLLNWPVDVDVRDYMNPDGTRKILRGTTLGTTETDNPFWDAYKNTAEDRLDRFNGNLTINYDPTKWLSLGLITGLDLYTQSGDYLVHPQSRYGFATQGFYSIYEQVTKNWNNVLKATLKKKAGDFNNTLTVGFAADDNRTRIDGQRGEQFFEQNFKSINNTAPTSRDAKTTLLNTRKVRFFGTYGLSYQNIAYLTLSGSHEGNSTLMSRQIDKNPFYTYGAAAFSFIFTDLKWFENIDWLNYMKGRISYGTTGKAPYTPYIIDYTFQSQLTTGGGYAYGFTGNNFGLQPEYTKNFEFGGEFRFFGDRLSLDITRYSLKSEDQILAARSSYGTGYVILWFNGGLVENKGIEAIIKGTPVKNTDFMWDVTVNFDRNRGKILEMPADLPTYYDSDTWVFGNLRSQAYAGAANGNLSSWSLARNANGDILINPTSGLPVSSGDFVIAGDRQPDFKVGLINNFTYKDFSLSFNLDFRKGGDVFNGNEYFLFLTGLSTRTLDRENPIVINGVLNDGLQNTTDPTKNSIVITPYYRSDFFGTTVNTEADFIEEVSWMRLRDATLSYNLPQSFLKKQKVFKSASVYVTGTDLFMVTNYTGADPSVNANTAFARGYGGAGIDYGTLATPRGILFGVNVKF